MDNLENSHLEVLHRVRTLASQFHKKAGLATALHPPLYFHSSDLQDRRQVAEVFDTYARDPSASERRRGIQFASRIVAAIHFAALKSVSGRFISWFDHEHLRAFDPAY